MSATLHSQLLTSLQSWRTANFLNRMLCAICAGLPPRSCCIGWPNSCCLPCPRFFISQYPEVEAKVVAELKGLGLAASPEAPTPRQLAFDDLAQLPYLAAVIKVQAQKLSSETWRRSEQRRLEWRLYSCSLCEALGLLHSWTHHAGGVLARLVAQIRH